jgi:hypothetical protein
MTNRFVFSNSLLAMLGLVFVFLLAACGDTSASNDPDVTGEISSSSENSGTSSFEGVSSAAAQYAYCVNHNTQVCISGSFSSCSPDAVLDNTCPYSSITEYSSSAEFGGSSSSFEGGVSSGEEAVSSSSAPPAAESYPKLAEGQDGVQRGWNSRYWDGCRAHCTLPQNAWVGTSYDPSTENLPSEAFDMICKACDKDNNEVAAYFWYNDWQKWFSNNSSCEQGGPIPGANIYTCWDMAPVAVNDTLAYAFAATPGTGDQCGKCFQIQFTGEWKDVPDKPLPTHQALKGKTMIVMSSNIGHDVSGGQFDVLIPGGGVGAFNSFSDQLGMSAEALGSRMGGLLTDCDNEITGWSATLDQWQTCLRNKCNATFGDKSKILLEGCLWQADWYMAANNPSVLYKEVECPQYLIDKYRSNIR